MDALDFIGKNTSRQPYYFISGDEDFLRRMVVARIQPLVLEEADPEFSVTVFSGENTHFSTVRNELDSVSFFSPRRLVIVEQGDKFTTEFRPQLEAYVADPSTVGVLVLHLKTLASNTKLAKLVPSECHIVCKGPPEYRLPMWCTQWAQSQYAKKLPNPAAQLLVQYVGTSMGVLDQELHKLSDYVNKRETITVQDVDDLVGRSRGAVVFKIFDAIGDGKIPDALKMLQSVIEQDEPIKILAGIGYQVKKLARIARMSAQGIPLEEALGKAGIPPFSRDSTMKQLRHLGKSRLDKLYDWLIDLDSGLKGGNPLPDYLQLERFIVMLSKERAK